MIIVHRCDIVERVDIKEDNRVSEAKAYQERIDEPSLGHSGIQIPNFAYEFSIVEGLRQLSDTTDGSFLLHLHNQKGSANPLMITVGIDNRFVGDAGITRIVKKSSGESTSLSKEIDEYMDTRSFMQNVRGGPSSASVEERSASSRKKQKIIVGAGNIILSNENKEVNEHIIPSASSNSMKKPSLKELILSLQVALIEAGIVSVETAGGINEEERDSELHKHLDKENKKLVDLNKRLQYRLILTEKDIEKLYREIATKQVNGVVLEATMKSMDERHKLVMANLSKSHEEALEKYKVYTMQSFQDYFPDLKSNFLLHVQVVGGPFDAYRHSSTVKVDFNLTAVLKRDWRFQQQLQAIGAVVSNLTTTVTNLTATAVFNLTGGKHTAHPN
ncbi:hypothetical protein J1N35_018135 [Gossypium stocksii]|uniref:Uncharacterized protein n=1 Tax=Gossypium stocksii TaxID=47602 RepID=A0A9D4A6D8_9ROSI|nr:hypothetical protein J1N35_018135 [Gossypium stocksii]